MKDWRKIRQGYSIPDGFLHWRNKSVGGRLSLTNFSATEIFPSETYENPSEMYVPEGNIFVAEKSVRDNLFPTDLFRQ